MAAIAIGYVCGSLPFGLWLGRAFRGVDVRTLGSGNLGATNVFRSVGRTVGIATLVLDMLKGALPVAIVPRSAIGATFPGGPLACGITVGAAATLGHMFTFLAGFRGGKGVATTAGVVLALFPAAFGIAAVAFVVTVAASHYISLGSILAAVVFALVLGLGARGEGSAMRTTFGVLVAALVIVRHHENIRRLLRGEERRFTWGRSR
jgi:glycerol-3-phosphate acyltransferase PlsY